MLLALVLASSIIVGSRYALLAGLSTGFAYAIASKQLISFHHRRGIRLVRARQWADAASAFRQSYSFFSRHPWLDRYRAVFLMSSSAPSYREMALLNEAFALAQQGLHTEARSVYERTLIEFPDSPIAESALNLMGPAA